MQLVTTTDGSHSLYNPSLNEHYHSINGAVKESKHVYIHAGLHVLNPDIKQINVLEVGFGTGLNAYLTLLETEFKNSEIHYTTLEPNPIDESIYNNLNYPELLEDGLDTTEFFTLHSAAWNVPGRIAEKFVLYKLQEKVQDAELDSEYHLVFFDAFAPEVQPEMWTKEVFKKLYNSLLPGGVLVTYCAKGEVKRNLQEVGFVVEALPGAPGKREMTRAMKA